MRAIEDEQGGGARERIDDLLGRLEAAEREARHLKADVALRDQVAAQTAGRTHAMAVAYEARIAQVEAAWRADMLARIASEDAARFEAEAVRAELASIRSGFAYQVARKAAQLRDRSCPAGSRRRTLANQAVQAARVLARQGPKALAHKAGSRLKRKFRAARPRFAPLAPAPLPPLPRPIEFINAIEAPAFDLPAGPELSALEAARAVILPYRRSAQGAGVRRISVASSSRGNYFFREIRDLIAAGLRELGHSVKLVDERDGLREDDDWQIIVAPHEYFFLGEGEALRDGPWPSNVILVTTEQPSTPWFATAFPCLNKAQAVWDMSFQTARFLRQSGIACDYLPLGFVPGFADFGPVREMPVHYGSGYLGDEVRRSASAGGALAERPIDLLFLGHNTPRRESFFARAAPALSEYRSYFHLSSLGTPHLDGVTTFMNTPTAIGLAQRSKVVLNLHQGDDTYFEWHRIVLHGIWQRALVISEPCGIAPPFRPGIDFVEARLDQIPRVVRHFLGTEAGLQQAQQIVDAGYQTLAGECRMADVLRTLLARPASEGVVLAHYGEPRPARLGA